jgi:hypothetical protein
MCSVQFAVVVYSVLINSESEGGLVVVAFYCNGPIESNCLSYVKTENETCNYSWRQGWIVKTHIIGVGTHFRTFSFLFNRIY